MRKRIKKLLSSRIMVFALLPFLLLMLWIVLTLIQIATFDTSFSIISNNHSKSNFENINYELLERSKSFRGEFEAGENNLGIVAIRFQPHIRPPYKLEDQILFRIKEKEEKDWYYQNVYRVGHIYDVPFFPFGFPVIATSKNKIYEIEITSLQGSKNNTVSISSREPILVSKYKYSKSELLSNKKEFFNFLLNKHINALKTPDIWFSSLFYFLPIFIYLTSIIFFNSTYFYKHNKNKNVLKDNSNFLRKYKEVYPFTLIFLLVLVDVYFFQLNKSIVYLVVISILIFCSLIYKRFFKITFSFSFVLLLFSFIYYLSNKVIISETFTIWALIFLITGWIDILLNFKNVKQN